jgi:hypothetical protein
MIKRSNKKYQYRGDNSLALPRNKLLTAPVEATACAVSRVDVLNGCVKE